MTRYYYFENTLFPTSAPPEQPRIVRHINGQKPRPLDFVEIGNKPRFCDFIITVLHDTSRKGYKDALDEFFDPSFDTFKMYGAWYEPDKTEMSHWLIWRTKSEVIVSLTTLIA